MGCYVVVEEEYTRSLKEPPLRLLGFFGALTLTIRFLDLPVVRAVEERTAFHR